MSTDALDQAAPTSKGSDRKSWIILGVASLVAATHAVDARAPMGR